MRPVLDSAVAAPVLLVACDYDGTLAPIVDDPAAAHPDARAIQAMRDLEALPNTAVAIISGRARADLAGFLGDMASVVLIGGHGGEWEDGTATSQADALAARLEQIAGEFPGATVEPKPTGAAFHYRLVDDDTAEDAASAAIVAAADLAARVVRGKRVVEFSISDADKGSALQRLRDKISPDVTIFIGDDVTDEDAFAALGSTDIAVKVGEGDTIAAWRLEGQFDVAPLLEELSTRRGDAG
jgi:trehalose 6-phosphate phosphatase